MYDINFFRSHKKRKSKSNGFVVFAVVLLLILLVFNAIVLGGGYLLTNDLVKDIATHRAFIESDDTKTKLAEATRLRQEVDLTGDYLQALTAAGDGFDRINLVDTSLMAQIRAMTPVTTFIESSQVDGNTIQLSCVSTNSNDPIDMYRALVSNQRFAGVTFGGFIIDPETDHSIFSIGFQVAGGIEP